MKSLLDKTNLKNMSLKNRFFKAAVWEGLATVDGHLTSELSEIYKELSQGGIGTIITGYAYVTENEQPNPNMMGIYNDSFIQEYKEFTDMIHRNGANVIMQMVYGGSLTHLNPPSENIFSPSGVKDEISGVIPKIMSEDDIEFLIYKFASAARRAKQSGFDGIQIHAAHGYLLSQFLSPYFNRRSDKYGGNVQNRSRITVEILNSIRSEVGEDFLVLIKINSEDYFEGGLTSQESIEISKILEKAGADAIEVSGGNESTKSVLDNNSGPARKKVYGSKTRKSYFREHASELAKKVKIPIILTGGNRHYDVMETILNESDIKYFAIGRPMICEPGLINKWKENSELSPKCVSCNKCYWTHGKRCFLNMKAL